MHVARETCTWTIVRPGAKKGWEPLLYTKATCCKVCVKAQVMEHTDCYYCLDESSRKHTASSVLAVLIRPATRTLEMTKHNWCYITFWEMKVSIFAALELSFVTLSCFLSLSVSLSLSLSLSLSFDISHSLSLDLLPSCPLWRMRETESGWEYINVCVLDKEVRVFRWTSSAGGQ